MSNYKKETFLTEHTADWPSDNGGGETASNIRAYIASDVYSASSRFVSDTTVYEVVIVDSTLPVESLSATFDQGSLSEASDGIANIAYYSAALQEPLVISVFKTEPASASSGSSIDVSDFFCAIALSNI